VKNRVIGNTLNRCASWSRRVCMVTTSRSSAGTTGSAGKEDVRIEAHVKCIFVYDRTRFLDEGITNNFFFFFFNSVLASF